MAGRSRNSPPSLCEQRLHFAAQFGIGFGQQRRALLGGALASRMDIALRFAGNDPGSCSPSRGAGPTPAPARLLRNPSRAARCAARCRARSRFPLRSIRRSSATPPPWPGARQSARTPSGRHRARSSTGPAPAPERPSPRGSLGSPAAAFARTLGASGVHQNAAHHLRRHRKKLGALPPFHITHIHQAKVDLMDQRGGLKRIAPGAHFS